MLLTGNYPACAPAGSADPRFDPDHAHRGNAGFFYYTMELADSLSEESYIPATLSNIIRYQGRLSSGEVLELAGQILPVLDVMHRKNLIHRDIKPENIIQVDGKFKLSDIGLMRSTIQTLTFAGLWDSSRRRNWRQIPEPRPRRMIFTLWARCCTAPGAAILRRNFPRSRLKSPPRNFAIAKKCLQLSARNGYLPAKSFWKDDTYSKFGYHHQGKWYPFPEDQEGDKLKKELENFCRVTSLKRVPW